MVNGQSGNYEAVAEVGGRTIAGQRRRNTRPWAPVSFLGFHLLMKILDRYIFGEMLWPFLGGLLTFVVLITGHMLFLAIEVMVEHRVSFANVLRYVGYQVPGAMVMALPVATLLAAALALNRLAKDHEIVALRAGGMTSFRLMAPACCLGLVAGALSVWLSGHAAPWSKRASDNLLRDIVLQQKSLAFKPHHFEDTGRGIYVYVEQVDNARNTVGGLHVFNLRPEAPPILVLAKQAQFGEATLTAPESRSYAMETNGALTWLESGATEVNLTKIGGSSAPGSTEMQTLGFRELYAEWRRVAASSPAAGRPYEMELHSRLALAFACLVFALLAGPVTLRFGRGQSLVGVLATILILFVFYVVMLWMRMLGNSGALPPLLAAWGQDVLLLGIAGYAIARQG